MLLLVSVRRKSGCSPTTVRTMSLRDSTQYHNTVVAKSLKLRFSPTARTGTRDFAKAFATRTFTTPHTRKPSAFERRCGNCGPSCLVADVEAFLSLASQTHEHVSTRGHDRTMARFQHARNDTRPPIVQNKRGRHALAFLFPFTLSGFPSFLVVDTRAFPRV